MKTTQAAFMVAASPVEATKVPVSGKPFNQERITRPVEPQKPLERQTTRPKQPVNHEKMQQDAKRISHQIDKNQEVKSKDQTPVETVTDDKTDHQSLTQVSEETTEKDKTQETEVVELDMVTLVAMGAPQVSQVDQTTLDSIQTTENATSELQFQSGPSPHAIEAFSMLMDQVEKLLAQVPIKEGQIPDVSGESSPFEDLMLELDLFAFKQSISQEETLPGDKQLDALVKQLTQLLDRAQKVDLSESKGTLVSLTQVLEAMQGKVEGFKHHAEKVQVDGENDHQMITSEGQVIKSQSLGQGHGQTQTFNQEEPGLDKTVQAPVKADHSHKSDEAKFNLKTDGQGGFDKTLDVKVQTETIDKMESLKTVTRASVFDQVKTAIIKQSIKASDHSEMVIKLKPEELGKVELKIEVHKDSVIAKFDVASQMVKETIESNLSDLRNTLKQKGFSDMTFDVNVSKDQTQKESQHSHRPRQNKRTRVSMDVSFEEREMIYTKTLGGMINQSQFEYLG